MIDKAPVMIADGERRIVERGDEILTHIAD